VRRAIASCISNSCGGTSLPFRWILYAGGLPWRRRQRDIDVDGHSEKSGQRAIGGDVLAVGIVRDGDRDGGGLENGVQRAQTLAQFVRAEIVNRVEGSRVTVPAQQVPETGGFVLTLGAHVDWAARRLAHAAPTVCSLARGGSGNPDRSNPAHLADARARCRRVTLAKCQFSTHEPAVLRQR
jgi:hypothetical protein